MVSMLKLDLINELKTMLSSYKVYIPSFKYSIELNTLESLKLIIYSNHTPQTEHRSRNTHYINEVTVLIVDEEEVPKGSTTP